MDETDIKKRNGPLKRLYSSAEWCELIRKFISNGKTYKEV